MFKTLSKRFRKPKSPESTSSSQRSQSIASSINVPQADASIATTPSDAQDNRTKRENRNGLILLSDTSQLKGKEGTLDVDIVAIHGLNGGAYSTWEHENSESWLEKSLPSAVPGARIYTYGYPSQLFFSKSMATLQDYSRRLLASLVYLAEDDRPIIFICHSLGGIVCKQALVIAHDENHRYGRILSATSSIVFFGTPHRGAHGVADVGKAVGAVLNACLLVSQTSGITGTTRTDLLKTLEFNSDSLNNLSTSFRNRLNTLEIVTFYETRAAPMLRDLVVDKQSAIMEVQNEELIPLYADHMSMCRLPDKTEACVLVVNVIRRLAREASKDRENAGKKRISSERSLNETEKTCMVLLNSSNVPEYKADLPVPVEGTFGWILTHPNFVSWKDDNETALLWITGDPGCGKTVLSAYVVEYLSSGGSVSRHLQVVYFFCDDKIATQRDASAILRSILFQLLQRHRRLIKHVKSRYDTCGPSLTTSFLALWELFLWITDNIESGPLGIIVDAIDECEQKTRQKFVSAVMKLVIESQKSETRRKTQIKFFITSRPLFVDSYDLERIHDKVRLPIEQNQSRISEDIKLVIKSKVGGIVRKLGCSDETKKYLESTLYAKADHTFLWLEMVLQVLEQTALASKTNMQQIISTLPRDLETTYEKFLYRIPQENSANAQKIFALLIGSSRSLTLMEMNIAFTIDKDHRNIKEVENESQPLMNWTLQKIVGPFVRITSSTVSLIHLSAKEFLIDRAPRSPDPVIKSQGLSLVDAASSIAWSCIQYILLQDFETDLFTTARKSIDTVSPVSPIPVDDGDLENSLVFGDALFSGQFTIEDEEEICEALAQKYQFFDYAATNWARHYSQCEMIAPDHMRELVRHLVKNESFILRNWSRYYWIKANLGYDFPDDWNDVFVAAFFNMPILLSELLEPQGPYDQQRKDRALFWAARMGSSKSVQVLLQHEADPNRQGVDLHTPLTIAAQYGHDGAVQTLLANPRTNVMSGGKAKRSALSFAAGNGHVDIVKLLKSHHDYQREDQDENRWTPLFWATGGDHIETIRYLLTDTSMDHNKVDKSGRSAFSWACGDGFTSVHKIWLRHAGLNINLKDSTGRSPLSWAAGNGRAEVVATLLRSKRIDKLSKDFEQRNVISWACQGGHTETLRVLLKYDCPGADDEDINGWTPLAWALNGSYSSTVEVLLSTSKIQLQRKDKGGRTALMWAATYGYLVVVQLLLSYGADAQVKTDDGLVAADYARMYGHMDVVAWMEQSSDSG